MIQTKSYKLIYLILICGLICSFFGTNIPETVAATSSKQLLTQADFKYLGAFELPSSVPSGADTGWGRGLAIRSVNGELRAFSAAWTASGPQSVYEVRVPATFSGTPTASLVKEWGDITHGKMVAANGNPKIVGLYWDQTDQRLYWSYQDGYNASGGSDPSLGYSTLSDSGSSTAYGPWYFPSTGPKATGGCVVPVPDWFASSYASGRRLAAGCGGPWSAATVGPAQFGPALSAFNPSSLSGSTVSATTLVGYPFSSTIYGPPDRAHRDTNYSLPGGNDWIGWLPKNGIGYWTDGDWLWQGGAWIDLPDKHGVIFLPTMVSGSFYYQSSTIHGAEGFHEWMVYDPADLARVAQGRAQEWEIQPKSWWSVQYPGLSYPLPSWSDLQNNSVMGVAFDPTTRRLYVSVRFAAVYVYEVQSSSTDTTPPAPPTGLSIK